MKSVALIIFVALAVGAGTGAGGYFIGRGHTVQTRTAAAPVPSVSPLCMDALQRRQALITAALNYKPVAGTSAAAYEADDRFRNISNFQLTKAENDIHQYC